MSTPKLYMVSVTYETMVLATSPKKANEYARDQGPATGVRNFRAAAVPATTSSLSPEDRNSIPPTAHGVTDPFSHLVHEGFSAIETLRNGNLQRKPAIIVHGRAAHGSMPEKGVNALEKMSALVLALMMLVCAFIAHFAGWLSRQPDPHRSLVP